MKTGNTGDNDTDQELEPEIDSALSAVASAPAKNIFIMVVAGILLLLVFWYAFFSPTDEEKKEAAKKPPVEVSNKIATSKPAVPEPETHIAALPALPAPPPLVVPTPPPPPPVQAAPQLPSASAVVALVEEEHTEKTPVMSDARKKSSIMLGGGGGGGGSGGGEDKLSKLLGGKKIDIGEDGNFTPEQTSATQQKVTHVGDMGSLIAQGKIIDAILETAINTDLPGVLRAVVSRDVYAEAGKEILIPKGSRLIGQYEAEIKLGQRRVNIIWSRAILPNGYDIMIDSPAVDQLGRAGVEGVVDNKFKELFTSAIMVSTISTGFAIAAQNLAGGDDTSTTSTTTNASGTTTSTTADATQTAIADAVQQIGSVGQGITEQLINVKPTITIDQGARIKVFVNRDLIFPNDMAQKVQFVR